MLLNHDWVVVCKIDGHRQKSTFSFILITVTRFAQFQSLTRRLLRLACVPKPLNTALFVSLSVPCYARLGRPLLDKCKFDLLKAITRRIDTAFRAIHYQND